MKRSPAAFLLAAALVFALCLSAAQAATPKPPKAPEPPPSNKRNGRVTQADINFFNRWEQRSDQLDETLSQAIEAYAKGCEQVKRYPAGAASYKNVAAKLAQTAGKLEAHWDALDTAAAALDPRSHSYSSPKIVFIVGSASDALSHNFFRRKAGVEALKFAAERLSRLNCSVDEQIADYKSERAYEQKHFPEAMEHLEFVINRER